MLYYKVSCFVKFCWDKDCEKGDKNAIRGVFPLEGVAFVRPTPNLRWLQKLYSLCKEIEQMEEFEQRAHLVEVSSGFVHVNVLQLDRFLWTTRLMYAYSVCVCVCVDYCRLPLEVAHSSLIYVKFSLIRRDERTHSNFDGSHVKYSFYYKFAIKLCPLNHQHHRTVNTRST